MSLHRELLVNGQPSQTNEASKHQQFVSAHTLSRCCFCYHKPTQYLLPSKERAGHVSCMVTHGAAEFCKIEKCVCIKLSQQCPTYVRVEIVITLYFALDVGRKH